MEEIDNLDAQLDASPDELAALEACWTAGARGWQLRLFAIYRKPSADHPRYTSTLLWNVSYGSEISGVFCRDDPWPETRLASALGEALAATRRVPFYFPAPKLPDDQCARWWERSNSHPCTSCGIGLRNGFLGRPWPWPGACARCIEARELAGGIDVNVHVTGLSIASREDFVAQREAWFEVVSAAGVGLVKLVNVLSDTELWVMLVVDSRELGVAAVLAHLRATGRLSAAIVTVARDEGRAERVWPRSA